MTHLTLSILGPDDLRDGTRRGPMTPAEVAEALARHGVGAVCILKCGMVCVVEDDALAPNPEGAARYDLGGMFSGYHHNGTYQQNDDFDIVCVLPPGTQLHADYTATTPKESLDFAQSRVEGMEPKDS
jgi:hypothetical protein